MAYSSIPSGWRDIGQAVKKELVDLIHTNLEDLDGRVTNVEGAISTQIIANQLINKERDHAPIGTMVWSPLSAAQFATATDDGVWQLCDGSSVSGTDYGTLMSRSVAPDLRGKFIRMRAHGTTTTYNADGDVATDTVQAQATLLHSHVMNHGHTDTFAVGNVAFPTSTHTHLTPHVHQSLYTDTFGGTTDRLWAMNTRVPTTLSFIGATTGTTTVVQWDHSTVGAGSQEGLSTFTTGTAFYTGGAITSSGGNAVSAGPSATDVDFITGSVNTFSGSTSNNTGATAETRPHNVTEECFVKVNKNYITTRTGYLLWRAPQALTINQVVLTPVTQGTSGTLTVDIKKGPLTSITTSIFTATPSLVYSATTAQTGTINATNAVLAAGDYVRVDITATQAKLQAFHILIAATPS